MFVSAEMGGLAAATVKQALTVSKRDLDVW
jgi:hypothetical protein